MVRDRAEWRWEGEMAKQSKTSEYAPSVLAPTLCRAGKPGGALHWWRAQLQFG